MEKGVPPLKIKNPFEANHLKSRFLVCGLIVAQDTSQRAK